MNTVCIVPLWHACGVSARREVGKLEEGIPTAGDDKFLPLRNERFKDKASKSLVACSNSLATSLLSSATAYQLQ